MAVITADATPAPKVVSVASQKDPHEMESFRQMDLGAARISTFRYRCVLSKVPTGVANRTDAPRDCRRSTLSATAAYPLREKLHPARATEGLK